MEEILEKIQEIGVVPVVSLYDPKDALPLAEALCEGGLPCAEITFRRDQAKDAIGIMCRSFPEMLVGGGTILRTDQLDEAAKAGAKFVVSPGFNKKIVKHSIEKGVFMIPGCSTPSDIEQALEQGIHVVKFFPAEAAGGLKMLKALSGPYKDVKFMATGGISEENVSSYLAFRSVLACGGSWMVKEEWLKAGEFFKIKEAAKRVVNIVRESRGKK